MPRRNREKPHSGAVRGVIHGEIGLLRLSQVNRLGTISG